MDAYLVTGEKNFVIAVLRDANIQQATGEVRSGFCGVVYAHYANPDKFEWNGYIVGMKSSLAVNFLNQTNLTNNLKLIVYRDADKSIVCNRCIVINFAIEDDNFKLSGQCLPDSENVVGVVYSGVRPEMVMSDMLPPPAKELLQSLLLSTKKKEPNVVATTTATKIPMNTRGTGIWRGTDVWPITTSTCEMCQDGRHQHCSHHGCDCYCVCAQAGRTSAGTEQAPAKPTLPMFPVKREVDFDTEE